MVRSMWIQIAAMLSSRTPSLAAQVYDMMRPLQLPLQDHDEMRAMLMQKRLLRTDCALGHESDTYALPAWLRRCMT